MEIESEYSQAESAANKYLCVSVLMLVDWDTIAGWAGEKQGKRRLSSLINSICPTLAFNLSSRNYKNSKDIDSN